MKTRIEKDSLGELKVPADALYGVQAARAVHNFQISGLKKLLQLIAPFHILNGSRQYNGYFW